MTDVPSSDAEEPVVIDRAASLAANDFQPRHRIVEPDAWRDTLVELKAEGYIYFDWLSAVDEEDGVRLVTHLLRPNPWDHLLVATFLAAGQTAQSVADVFAGAAWHERETHEMFGLAFGDGESPASGRYPQHRPLLLPDGFEGHPLRKDFVLASRVVKPWPGAKEPGESDHDLKGRSPGRRRVKPPGVPDDWIQDPDDRVEPEGLVSRSPESDE